MEKVRIKFLFQIWLSVFFIISGTAFATSSDNGSFYSEWQNQMRSHQALREAEDDLQKAYHFALEMAGSKTAEADRLVMEQENWNKNRQAKALTKGAPGAVDFNDVLIHSAKERTQFLIARANKGRIISYQQYQPIPGQGLAGSMRIWQFEDAHTEIIFNITDSMTATNSHIHIDYAERVDEIITFSPPGISAITLFISPYNDNARAKVSINSPTGEIPDGFSVAGRYIRTDMPIDATGIALEQVALCQLGKNQSRFLQIRRSHVDPDSVFHVYYVRTQEGLRPLAAFSDKKNEAYSHIENSQGNQVRIYCLGEQEKILLLTGEFSSHYISIYAFRYNEKYKKWQTLFTAQRSEPSLIYLSDDQIMLIFPDISTENKRYTIIYSLSGEEDLSNDQDNYLQTDTLPYSGEFTVISMEN